MGATGVRGPRIPLPLLLTPIVAAMVVSTVADVLGPNLITERPLLQIGLNPRSRYLLLAAPQVAAVPFFVVGFLRLTLTDPLAYVLGRQHGDRALAWVAQRSDEDGVLVERVLRWFGKAAPVVVLVAPNLYVCALSGATNMRPRVFVPLNVLGTIGRLLLFLAVGDALREPLEDVLDVIERYQWPLVALSFVVVSLQMRRQRARGRFRPPPRTEAELEREVEQPD